MKTPAEILIEKREAMGWTQTQLGDRVGLGLRAIQKLEDNIFPKFKRDSIEAIDKVLGTNLYELIYEQKSHTIQNEPTDKGTEKQDTQTEKPNNSPNFGYSDLLEKLINSNYLLAQASNTKASADKIKAETERINAEATLRMVAN